MLSVFFCQVDSLLLKILSDSNGIYSFLMASYIDKYDHGNMVSQCPKGKVDWLSLLKHELLLRFTWQNDFWQHIMYQKSNNVLTKCLGPDTSDYPYVWCILYQYEDI